MKKERLLKEFRVYLLKAQSIMYNIYDKSNVFYVYNHQKNQTYLIGDRDEFINYLAKDIKTFGYKDKNRWTLSSLEDQNLTMNDTKSIPTGYYEYPEYKQYLRYLTFFDGYERIVNIKDYLNEAIDYLNKGKVHYTKRKSFYRNYQKHYSGNYFKNKMPQTFRTKRLNSILEYKKFVRQRDKEFPDYWDDTSRRISCNWKDQYKCKKQWGHKRHIDKNSLSIRNNFIEDDYDIDSLLEFDKISTNPLALADGLCKRD